MLLRGLLVQSAFTNWSEKQRAWYARTGSAYYIGNWEEDLPITIILKNKNMFQQTELIISYSSKDFVDELNASLSSLNSNGKTIVDIKYSTIATNMGGFSALIIYS